MSPWWAWPCRCVLQGLGAAGRRPLTARSLARQFGALVHRVVSGLTVARLGPSRSGLLGDVLFMAVLLAALLDVPALAPRAVALAAAGVVALALALPWLAPRGSAIQGTRPRSLAPCCCRRGVRY